MGNGGGSTSVKSIRGRKLSRRDHAAWAVTMHESPGAIRLPAPKVRVMQQQAMEESALHRAPKNLWFYY